jgi:DNA (cytosine-5)-methyltransferase 1
LDSGAYIIAGIDNDEGCTDTYCYNNRNSMLDGSTPAFLPFNMLPALPDYPQGQQHLVWEQLRELIPHYRKIAPGIPLMFAICAPCQSFTKFIQRRMTDSRSLDRQRDQSLLHQTLPFIEEFEPEMVLSENVATLRLGKFSSIWHDFKRNLQELGYEANEDGVCVSNFGVPQYRRRSVLLALKHNGGSPILTSLRVPDRNQDEHRISTKEAIGHFPALKAGETCSDVPNHKCRNLTQINRLRLKAVKPREPNFGFDNTPFGDLSLPCHRRLARSGKRGFGDVYTRMHPDRPSPTITTRFHSISNGRFGHYDESQVRAISLREGAKLQSFPDDYRFYGNSMESIARMIGNAVPPKLAEYMSEWLVNYWAEANSGGVVE